MAYDDPFAQPPSEKTLIVPSPGMRGGARAANTAAPQGTTTRYPRGDLSALDWHTGLNPLIAAANPLLNLVPQLRQAQHPDPLGLRETLARAVAMFESKAQEQGVPHDQMIAARYALCTFLDENAANTPWGDKVWAQRSLLVQFHNEAWGGEKFFQLLGKLAENPATYQHLLELFYVILSLGFEGRYRVIQNGRAQLASVREKLNQMLRNQRDDPSRELSPAWQTTATARRPLRESFPLWAVATIAALLLALVYMLASFTLNRHSDPTFASILALKASPPTPAAPPAPVATAAPAAPAPARLAHFLAPEIQAGRVVVRDLDDRSIVTARGDGLFEAGSATLSSSFAELLGRIGEAVAKVDGSVLVRGHTDNRPIRSARFPSNWHLSQARAVAVAEELTPRLGNRPKINTEGSADSEPVASNDTPDGRAQNRRVEIIVFPATRH